MTTNQILRHKLRKNYVIELILVHYRMLKFFVRHGMAVDKNHEIISFKHNKSLEKIKFLYTKEKSSCE